MHAIRRLSVVSLACLTLLPVANVWAEEAVVRQGFTIGVSLGPGFALLNPKNGDSKNDGGLSGNLIIGGFLNQDFALLFKVTGVNWGPFDSQLSTGGTAVFGPAAEYWLSDHFNIVGGVGLGSLQIQPKFLSNYSEYGFGATAGLNYFPWALRHHGLGLSIDVVPIVTSNYFVLNYQAGFSWQYY